MSTKKLQERWQQIHAELATEDRSWVVERLNEELETLDYELLARGAISTGDED